MTSSSRGAGVRTLAVVAGLVVVGVVVAIALARRERPTPDGGRGGPAPAVAPLGKAGIAPHLEAFALGGTTDAGELGVDAGLTVKVTLKAPGYVYLFDEYEGVPVLLSEHEGEVWEAGEYSTDVEPLAAIGRHRLVVVASPEQLPRAKEWRVLKEEAMAITCPRCEVSDVSMFVADPRGPQGARPPSGGSTAH